MTKARRILIAVDGSESSMGAVRYVSRFHDPGKTAVTLVHVMGELPEVLEDLKSIEHSDALVIETDHWQSQMTANAEKMMMSAQRILADAGYEKEAMEIKILKRTEGVAKDITIESAKGYDAVVVGRRGMNDPADIIVGATAYRMMSDIQRLPVVVVGDKPDPNHILVGFDGSENAFKAVDCVCRLMPRPGRRVMLCHVARSMSSYLEDKEGISDEKKKILEEQSRLKMKDLMAEAAGRLINAGFEPGLVSREIIEARVSRAVAIAKTAEKEGYGTIVIGRRGLSVIKDFLMGRVSMKVLHRAHEMAVWIV